MKHRFLLLVMLLSGIWSIKAQTPLQFNDDLVVISDSLYSKGQQWGVTFNNARKDGNFTILKQQTLYLLAYIDAQTLYVQDKKDVKNSKPLRTAMLDFLDFEKQMVSEGFKPFESFNASTPPEKVQAALDNLVEKSKDEDAFLKKLGAAQEAYGTENGFKIAPKQ